MKDRYAQTAVPARDEMATDTEIRPTICSICNPGSHCGVDAYVSNGRIIKVKGSMEAHKKGLKIIEVETVPPGVVNMYHGRPEADVNTLIDPDYRDPISGFPAFKSLLCEVQKAPE